MTKKLPLTKRITMSLGVLCLLLLSSNTIQAQLDVNFAVTDAICYGLPTGDVTATAFNGIPPYTYQWTTGDLGPTLSNVAAGTYTVTIFDASAASITRDVIIGEPAIVTATLLADDLCNDPFNITANGGGGIPPYNYNWSTGASTQTIFNVSAGEYCITVTDSNLCGVVECITVVPTPANVSVSVTNVPCNGDADGSIVATPTSGVPPFTYVWSNGGSGQVLSGLPSGSYTVTMTDANECTDTATGFVNQPSPIVISLTPSNPVCLGDFNGSITSIVSGGVPPYTLSWNTGQTSANIFDLGPGTYILTVIDANNCIQTASVTLNNISNFTLGGIGTPETCPDANDGYATANPQGGVMPYVFLWHTGFNEQVIQNAAPGQYFITVTDAVGCVQTTVVTVQAAPDFDVSVVGNNPSSCGLNNGSATAVINAGAGPFSYEWSNGGNTQTIINLAPGTYTVTVTNPNECTTTATTTLVAPPDVFVDATATSVLCPGSTSGTATATATGGTPPYLFTWSNGMTGSTIDNLSAGTYIVTVTDINACTDIDVVVIAQAPDVSFNLTGTTVVCGVGNTGTATATPLSGTPPFSFNWSTGATSPTVSGLTEGTHTVTVTDANGCSSTQSIDINIIDDLSVLVTGTNVLCTGENTGSATALPTGGDAPYTYAWSNGSNTPSLFGLLAGTYTVVVTDANGCTTNGAYTVTQPSPLSVNIVPNNPLNCFGNADASLTAVANGGTPAYSFVWSNGVTGATISNLPAGTYTVTVTDLNECTASASFTVTQTTELMVNLTGETTVCGAENDGFAGTIVTGGMPPYNYLWSTGAMTESITSLSSGTYQVTVTDNLGCTAEGNITINVISDFALTLIPRDVLCFGEDNGSVLAVASGGSMPYSYNWSNGAGNTNEITALTTGSYTLTVTEGNGCIITQTVVVEQPQLLSANITATNPACNGAADGFANVTVAGGTPPYQFNWSNGSTLPNITALVAGDYIVTVTDANFCTTTANVSLLDPPAMNVNVSAPIITCGGTQSGSATAFVTGGAGGYTYLWSNGQTTQTTVDIGAGVYSLTVTDANGCMEVVNAIVVSELPAIEINFNITHLECTAAPIGAVTAFAVNGNPPYTFVWSNGQNGETISNLSAGTYTVTVTDTDGCPAVRSAEVMQTDGFTIDLVAVDVACFGESNGNITVLTTGGEPPFAYSWGDGQNTPTINALAIGTYFVTVTDANECFTIGSVAIGQPDQLVAGINADNIDCGGEDTGSAVAVPSGGTPPYAFVWSNGSTDMMISNLAAGTYVLTITDVNECTAVNTVTITAPETLSVSISQNSGTCSNVTEGILVANTFGGTGPFSYLWSNGNMNQTASNLAPGTYSVTVTDSNDCTTTATAALTTFPSPNCSVVVLQTPTLGNNGSLQVNPDSGTPPYTYAWSNGGDTQIISDLAAGSYTVTVTDLNGCQTTCSATLEALAGIGNYVWEDIDHDGQQDPDEPAIPNVTVHLKDATGVIIATTTTDANGEYYFLGLDAGTYSVLFVIPDGMDYTASNMGDDALDSDIVAGMNGMTGIYVLDTGELDFTVDGGLYVPPNGVIGDPCACLNNSTTENNGQFIEVFTVHSYPNEIWTVIDGEGMYEASNGEPPVEPVLLTFPFDMTEIEPGTYEYPFRLIDEVEYTVVVTNGFDTLSISNVCEYPTINIDQLPDATMCLADAPIELGANPAIPGNMIFTINGVITTTIDPLLLNTGSFELIATLIPIDPEECEASIVTQFTITDDCLAEVGDLVWLDTNANGIQDPGEVGIPGVEVTITGTAEFLDPDVNMTTFTDASGNYLFIVPPGNYKITFASVPGYNLSPQNQGGDDALDSDVDPIMLMTEVFHLDPYEQNLTFDMGLYPDCINVTYPGAIGHNQYLCAPGNDPEPFVSLASPSGGDGPIEYVWMHTTGFPNTPIQYWTPLPDSNTPTYDSGPLFTTTYFARCARTEECGTFLEANIVVVEVGDETTANILGPNQVCWNQPSTFTAVDVEPFSQITWNFPGATPSTATGISATTTYTNGGNYVVELIVTLDGCTAYSYQMVSTTTLPTICGQGLIIDTDITDAETGELMVTWEMSANLSNLIYHVEYSSDGEDFERIATLTEETWLLNGIRYFEFAGRTPKRGLNYYRVEIEDDLGNAIYSNIEEVILYTDSKIAMLYPNPVNDKLYVEIFDTFGEEDVTLDVYAVSGQKMATIAVAVGQRNVEINFDQFPAGAYLVQLRLGETNIRTMKVVRR